MGPVKGSSEAAPLRAGAESPLYGGCAWPRARSAHLISNAQLTPARRVVHRSRVVTLAAHALANGGLRRSLTHVHWDASGDCETPQLVELEGRLNAAEKLSAWEPTEHDNIVMLQRGYHDPQYRFRDTFPHEAPLVVTMEVPCRRCPRCLARRARHWRIRAQEEISAAPRTWFGTMTLRPEEHNRALYAAHLRLSKGGTDFGQLSPCEQFREVHTEIGREVTKWLKRIRKESGARLRYILVAEKHKSGLPHYHMLVHETVGGGSVKERTLRKQWLLGFSLWKLVENHQGAARYVSKYLSKSAEARVRASLRYGSPSLDIANRVKREPNAPENQKIPVWLLSAIQVIED